MLATTVFGMAPSIAKLAHRIHVNHINAHVGHVENWSVGGLQLTDRHLVSKKNKGVISSHGELIRFRQTMPLEVLTSPKTQAVVTGAETVVCIKLNFIELFYNAVVFKLNLSTTFCFIQSLMKLLSLIVKCILCFLVPFSCSISRSQTRTSTHLSIIESVVRLIVIMVLSCITYLHIHVSIYHQEFQVPKMKDWAL